jgi:flagellar assembly factor FliW
MQLTTSRFGEITIDPESVITFTQPIIGFQEYRRFVLLPGPPDSVICWLQSAESGELAFLLLKPAEIIGDYKIALSQHELDELAAGGLDELEVYTLVVVPEDPSQIRTNLKAPILVNQRQKLAKQTVLEKSDYPIQFFLAQQQADAQAPREVSNARSDT